MPERRSSWRADGRAAKPIDIQDLTNDERVVLERQPPVPVSPYGKNRDDRYPPGTGRPVEDCEASRNGVVE